MGALRFLGAGTFFAFDSFVFLVLAAGAAFGAGVSSLTGSSTAAASATGSTAITGSSMVAMGNSPHKLGLRLGFWEFEAIGLQICSLNYP